MSVRYRQKNSEFGVSAGPGLNAVNDVVKELPLSEERLAILGHEIRNPLGALNAALNAWPSTNDDPQLTADLLQIMRRQVLQLTRLCNDLLDTGEISRGKLSICQASVDIGQVIRSACEQIRPFLEQCGHTITIAIGDSPLMMHVDGSRLIQVFANLLHNSAKFTQRNGHLQILLERFQDSVIIRVRDNGRGMDSIDLQNVFRTENASMRNSQASGAGLGIGLRLAKSIVELHGGTIEAFSQGLGLGSTFVVRLPIQEELAMNQSDSSSHPCAETQCNGLHLPNYRIVVVDDDRSMRFLMSHMLQKLDQTVVLADSGESALQVIPNHRPHVVFMDLQMHGISGYEVARQIRTRFEFNDIVLVAVSGHSDNASQTLAAESGFDHYLMKPIGMAELTEMLHRISELSTC